MKATSAAVSGCPSCHVDAGPDVDGPREAVGGDAAVLLRRQLGRELRDGLAVEPEPEEAVVGEVQHLGGRRLDPDEGAQVVGVGRPADAQRAPPAAGDGDDGAAAAPASPPAPTPAADGQRHQRDERASLVL